MNCHRIQNMISVYIDGELRGVEMLSVRQHMSDCAECKKEYESILLVKRSIGGLAPKTPPSDLADRILERLPSTSPERGILTSLRMYFMGTSHPLKLAGVGAMFILAALIFVHNNKPQQSMIADRPASPAIVNNDFTTVSPLFATPRKLRPDYFTFTPGNSFAGNWVPIPPPNPYPWLTGSSK